MKIKQKLHDMIPLILAPFTFLLFAPVEMVVRNTVALWFTWTDVFPLLLVTFAICLLILCFIGFILPEKGRKYHVALIFGLGIALYVQGNILPIDYGALDGRPVDWSSYSTYAIVNTFIWVVLLLAPIILTRFWFAITKKVMIYITCIVLIVQVVTTVYMIVQSPATTSAMQMIATDEYLHTVSSEKNIVVFVLDSIDTSHMNTLLEEEPSLKEELNGFTFFDNTIGMFPKTMGAVPHILTGEAFRNETTFSEYLDWAFSETSLYRTLHEQNFSILIHTVTSLISPIIMDYVDNINEVEWIINDRTAMTISLLNFAGLRYTPHVVREAMWMSFSDFDMHRTPNSGGESFVWENSKFYDTLMQGGLDVLIDRNVFSFIHLAGIREPIDRDVVALPDGRVPSFEERARGSIQLIIDYLSEMKNLGVDDNTLMIVMSDHGWEQLLQRPLFLIREPNNTSPLKISSEPVSFDDFMPMLKAYVYDGYSPIEYLHSIAPNRDIRTFYFYREDEHRPWFRNIYLPDLLVYEFTNSSDDMANARFTGIVHESGGYNFWVQSEYSLGTAIRFGSNFDQGFSPHDFFMEGLQMDGAEASWSTGHRSVFSARLSEPVSSDLELTMTFLVFPHGEGQSIRVYAGDWFIDEVFFPNLGWDTAQTANFIIPRVAIENDVSLEVRFEFPDAVLPEEVYWEYRQDVWYMAIEYIDLTISQVP